MRRWMLACLVAFALPALCAPAAAPALDRGADGLLLIPPLARVVDAGAYLSGPDRTGLEAKLAAFEARQGSQVAIILVPSTKPEPIEDFAHRVGEAWKIGRAGVGDGLLIVVAVQDHRARIDVARSLEGALPDALTSRIIQNQLGPRFATKDYAGGLEDALDVLIAHLSAEGLPQGAGEGSRAVGRTRGGGGEDRLHALLPFLFGGAFVGVFLRRLFGALGALLAAGGAFGLAAVAFSSIGFGVLAGVGVLVFAFLGGPFFAASQMLGVRGGGFSGGFGGGGGGGFRSGGGGDFSGGGASGSW